jgi:hypothetical protein
MSQRGGRYLKIDDTVYNSVAFRTLPDSALKLWIDLRTLYNGSNNGVLAVTARALERRGWNSNSKLHRARSELLARGLLKRTKHCGPNVFHRASLYAFTDVPVAANQEHAIRGSSATLEFLSWLPSAKHDVLQKAPNGTFCGTATGPSAGERHPETAPASGQRENERKPAPVLALRAIGK